MSWYQIVPFAWPLGNRSPAQTAPEDWSKIMSLISLITQTPAWVFALLAVLAVLGVQALKDRLLPLWRVLMVPVVFIGWGLAALLLQPVVSWVLVADWLASAALGIAIGFMTTPKNQFEVTSPRTIAVKGSALPLVRNLVIFTAKYALTATMLVQPMLRRTLAPWDIAVSGLAAGYFIGTLIHLMRAYRKPSADATVQA